MLIPLRFNELLDFVQLDHSASPDVMPEILSFNAPGAAWRFNFTCEQDWNCARGSEHSS
jgi:hypothetical protein